MIFVGLGANLESPLFGLPVRTLERALALLDAADCRVVRRSSWYESAPVPLSDQPWFVNGVAELATPLPPHRLLSRLLGIERDIGRVRTVPNAPRLVDLDLLVYGEKVLDAAPGLVLPHPRMNERAFVLLPLRELAPYWIDPRTGRSIDDLIRDLPTDQICRRLNPDKR